MALISLFLDSKVQSFVICSIRVRTVTVSWILLSVSFCFTLLHFYRLFFISIELHNTPLKSDVSKYMCNIHWFLCFVSCCYSVFIFNLKNVFHCWIKTKQVSYAKHISEALGADPHTDVSWTSSLNTPTESTWILSKRLHCFVIFSCHFQYKMICIGICLFTFSTAKHNKSPCPVSVSKEENVVVSISSRFNTLKKLQLT